MMPDIASATDEELAHRARAGCVDSFGQLMRRYQVPLMAFLQGKSRNRHDAEDLVQDCMLRAYTALHRYKDGYSFKAWLFTLSYRFAISQNRRASISFVDAPTDFSTDHCSGPLATLEETETRSRLWSLVRETVTEDQHTVLWLTYAESLTPREISTIMNRSWVWVRTALHRARRKLKIAMQSPSPLTAAQPILFEGGL